MDWNAEISVLEIYGEHPHSLMEGSSYGLGSLHLEPFFVDKKVFRSLRSITGLLSLCLFGNQSVEVVDSFLVHYLLNFCVDLKMLAVQVELGL